MPYLNLDDGFAEHPKIMGLSDGAFRLHVAALCYCARRMTDGDIPREAARTLSATAKPRHILELEASSLWITSATGWQVHDFLDWNRSRNEIEERREKDREKKRNQRRSNDGSFLSPGDTLGTSPGVSPPSTPLHSTPRTPTVSKNSPQPPLLAVGFDAFWEVYPRKVGKPAAAKSFRRALGNGAKDYEITAGAARWAEFWKADGTDTTFIPHPTTWLNRNGWDDEPPAPSKPVTRSGRNQSAINDVLGTLDTALNPQTAIEATSR